MALRDATAASLVGILGILAFCPMVAGHMNFDEWEHTHSESEENGLLAAQIIGFTTLFFVLVAGIVVAYKIYNMIPPKETIYYDDHCCCWSQLNKDDGPKQFNSVEFVRILSIIKRLTVYTTVLLSGVLSKPCHTWRPCVYLRDDKWRVRKWACCHLKSWRLRCHMLGETESPVREWLRRLTRHRVCRSVLLLACVVMLAHCMVAGGCVCLPD